MNKIIKCVCGSDVDTHFTKGFSSYTNGGRSYTYTFTCDNCGRKYESEVINVIKLDSQSEMTETGAEAYDKTHSRCCDALLTDNGQRCSACGQGQ